MKDQNPIDNLRFYTKENPDEAMIFRKNQVIRSINKTKFKHTSQAYKQTDRQTGMPMTPTRKTNNKSENKEKQTHK